MTEQDRAALILKIARRLMRAGRAKGWSDAMRLARAQVEEAS